MTWYVCIGFTKLNVIDAVLDIQVRSTDPASNIASITQKKITRHVADGYPVVGITVYDIPAGITVTGAPLSALRQ